MENFQKLKLKKKPQPRTLEEMKPVLKNPEITEKIGSDKIIYDVFREVKFKNPLRYDITFIYPVMLGDELPKTFGHCHKNLEIMEVVSGEVLWFLQKQNRVFECCLPLLIKLEIPVFYESLLRWKAQQSGHLDSIDCEV